MRHLLLAILLTLSSTSYADQIYVICYSQGKIIFNKHVDDVQPGDGYLVASDKLHTYAMTGDCLISLNNKRP